MKKILRNFLVNLGAIWVTMQIIPSIAFNNGIKGLAISALAFMIANILLIPLIRILLLPLNLLTLGLFAWLSNIIALYILVTNLPYLSITPYNFQGISFGSFALSPFPLSTFQTALLASLVIAIVIHFTSWLIK